MNILEKRYSTNFEVILLKESSILKSKDNESSYKSRERFDIYILLAYIRHRLQVNRRKHVCLAFSSVFSSVSFPP